MAFAGLTAIDAALLGQLNHASVTALVAQARHYNTVIPQDATFPVLVVSYRTSDLEGAAFEGDAEAYEYQVKGVTKGDLSVVAATAIAEAIDARLQGTTLAATGYTGGIYRIRRQRWLRYMEIGSDREPYTHAGAIYRLWAHRS